MNKILISVKVPLIDEEYDIFVPIFKSVSNVIELLEHGISELSHGDYIPTGKVMLYNSDGKPIARNTIIKNSGLYNGSNVTLI